MNIEKRMRKQAAIEEQQILDENRDFYENVLLPMVKKNKTAALEQQKAERERRKPLVRMAALIAAPAAALLIVAIIATHFLTKEAAEIPYLANYETRAADLAEVNVSLKRTRLSGEFQQVSMTYETKTGNAVRFTLSQEVSAPASLITCTIEVIIQRDYDPRGIVAWDGQFDAGFPVYYSETVKVGTLGDMPVKEFSVRAVMDTGDEMYYFTYEEITVNAESGFRDYVANTIQKIY